MNGGALVTACTAVTSLSLSANNVGFGAQVTLSWSGAAGGGGNPIRGYEVYRDGALLTTVTGTNCAVTSPTSNGSYRHTVRALGSIEGFDAPVSTASATLTSVVSAPGTPRNLRLSAYDIRINKSISLTWDAAAGGTNNSVAKYHVYRNGAFFAETFTTSFVTQAPGTAGGQYTFTVYAIGSVSGWNSGVSAGVTCTAHTAEYSDTYFTSSAAWTIPAWAEQLIVTCIGGGGGRGETGYRYGGTDYGGGGYGGGGTGEKKDATFGAGRFTPGAAVSVTVGAGGAASTYAFSDGGAGGSSAFGSLLTARGGAGGAHGDPSSDSRAPNGGKGGDGGIGGSGGGWSRYGPNSGNIGSSGAAGTDWSVPANDAAYYVFNDTATGRRLGTGGQGGVGVGLGGDERGNTTLAGTRYGSGGGRNNDGNGGAGIVAVRVGRYLS